MMAFEFCNHVTLLVTSHMMSCDIFQIKCNLNLIFLTCGKTN